MKSEEFVSVVKLVVEQNSISSVIKNLTESSNKQAHRLKYLSNWFQELDEADKHCIIEIIKESVSTSIFGIFCVLDGVRAIENRPEKGVLELYHVDNGNKILLNDSEKEFLHDIYKSLE